MFMSDIPVKYQHIPFADILRISKEFEVCPYLITAIGWHETNWGKLGLGRQGFHTGYGAYDSGPDERFAGLEKQIKGTAGILRRWGMKPGAVTLERLQRGNRGEFGGIYATDENWPNRVWYFYQHFKQTLDLGEEHEYNKDWLSEYWRERQKEIFMPGFEEWKRERGYLQRDIELGPTQQVVRIIVIIMLVFFLTFAVGWAFKDEAMKVVKTMKEVKQ